MTFSSLDFVDVRHRNNVHISGNPSGRPMVFANGFGCSQEVWRNVVPLFEQQYLVIRFDHVGSGGSDSSAYDSAKYGSIDGYATDLLEILDAEDLRDVVFVGHSVSTMMGVVAARRDPSRFGSLILVGPSPRYTSADNYVGGFERADIDALIESLSTNYLGWSATMAPVIVGNPDRPELGAELTTSFCSVDPRIAGEFAKVTFLSDNRDDLRHVTTPTLVIQCSDDIIAPTEVGEFVHESIAGSSFVQLAATGHCPNLSAPEELARAILAYLG